MNIAAMSYTVREFMHTPEDILQSLKKIRAIGYRAVQIASIDELTAEQWKQFAEEADIELVATHVSFPRLRSELDEMIQKHLDMGSRYVGIGSMPGNYRESYATYAAFAKEASEVGQTLKEAGLHLMYHNHDFEFLKYEGKTGMDILLEESDPETFGFELDVYWVQAAGGHPVDWIHKVKGRMEFIHLKDMGIDFSEKPRKPAYMEVGEGNMNFKAILEACRETGVKWGAVEQDICIGDPFDSLQVSFRNLSLLL